MDSAKRSFTARALQEFPHMKVDLLRGGQGWKLIDLDGARPVKLWLWADDASGQYEVCATDDHGCVLLSTDGRDVRREKRHGRILLVPPNTRPIVADHLAALRCAPLG
jgi:hypothetical protein